MFKFSLEPVLKHRRFVEEERQKGFIRRRDTLEREQAAMARLESARRNAAAALRANTGAGTTVADVLSYLRYIDRLKAETEIRQKAVDTAERALGEARAALLAAVKDRKVMEKLKEKRKDAYDATLRAKEQDFLNEIAISRHYRQSKHSDASENITCNPMC